MDSLTKGPANNDAGKAAGEIPLIAGEWWLATQMDNPSLDFYKGFGTTYILNLRVLLTLLHR